jgi:hypothetical protein
MRYDRVSGKLFGMYMSLIYGRGQIFYCLFLKEVPDQPLIFQPFSVPTVTLSAIEIRFFPWLVNKGDAVRELPMLAHPKVVK